MRYFLIFVSIRCMEATTATCGTIKSFYKSNCCGLSDDTVHECSEVNFESVGVDKLHIGPCFQLQTQDDPTEFPKIEPICGDHKVFMNGRIILMNEANSVVDALSVVGQRVHTFGTNNIVSRYIRNDTTVIDLQGATMTPGHIEGHAHFSYSGAIAGQLFLNTQAPPLGVVDSIERLVSVLQDRDANMNTGPLTSAGFSDTLGGRPPTSEDLDRVSTERIICVGHDSGHATYMNSKGIEAAKTLFASLGGDPIPESSINTVEYWTDPDSGDVGTVGYYPLDYPNASLRGTWDGSFWESTNSRLTVSTDVCRPTDISGALRGVELMSEKALSRGITMMAEESETLFGDIDILSTILPIRQKAFIQPSTSASSPFTQKEDPKPITYTCTDKYVWNKVKLFVDGSPQGYTAHMTTPYHTPAPSGPFAGNASWVGFSATTAEKLYVKMKKFHDLGWDLAMHTNGDAAIDIGLNALEMLHTYSDRRPERTVFIHCQFMRHDQVLRMKRLGASCSYFNQHNYYYGDRHELKFFGPLRAKNSSPLKWAIDVGMHFSTHSDEPITSSEPMMRLRTAMTRLTRSGNILGKHQRIGFMDAMKASTIWVAEQKGVDHCVGSLEPGKMFDAAIYDQDIMLMDPQDIYKAKVVQTWLNGEKVFDINVQPSPYKRLRMTIDGDDAVLINNGTSALVSGMVRTSLPTPSTFEGKDGDSYGFPVSDQAGNNL